MSYPLERRNEGWCVLLEDGSVAGTHVLRVDAIRQQRRLYANEARVASMYAELDSRPDVVIEPVVAVQPEQKSELVKVVVGDNGAMTASLMQQMERMSERQAATDQALVAALSAIGQRESVVNVAPASVTVEPSFTVEAPQVTFEAPAVNVPAAQITVMPADVNVTIPERSKTVTFERDPLTHEVTKAEVVET